MYSARVVSVGKDVARRCTVWPCKRDHQLMADLVADTLAPTFVTSLYKETLSHCRPLLPLPQKLFLTITVNGLHETKDYVSCGIVIICLEVIVVTLEEFLLKFEALGQARKLA